jgi:hypothetical protein
MLKIPHSLRDFEFCQCRQVICKKLVYSEKKQVNSTHSGYFDIVLYSISEL